MAAEVKVTILCEENPRNDCHAALALVSSWNTSTYRLRKFFLAACDRGRPIGGVLAPGAGVFGNDVISC